MLFLWCLVSLSFVEGTFSANILMADCMPSRSHQIWNYAVAEGLLARGHNVTMLGPLSVISIKHENYHFLNLGNLFQEAMKEFNQDDVVTGSTQDMMKFYYDYSIISCRASLKSEGFKTLMAYPENFKFDAILFDVTLSSCFFPFIQKFNYPPSIGITAFLLPPFLSISFGNGIQPSYLASFYTDYSNTMSFWQRLTNYVIIYADTFFRSVYMNRHVHNMVSEVFGKDMDSLSNLENHISLLLSNLDPVLHNPQPLTPNIIPVGGLHIKSKPLPQDLQEIMDTAPHGVILFALGTNIKSSDLTPEKKEVIISTFGKLKQTILWKFETNITNLPENVVVRKWLPQTDILAHPNLKLFISHSGGLSTMEASYFGIPVLGIPFFIDQHPNIDNLVSKGVAKKLEYHSITPESFMHNINELLYNKEYTDRMNKLSNRMRDQPQPPLERAVFWIEYAIRHNGTHFLNPKSRSLSLFVTSCTDIHLFVLAVLSLSIYIVCAFFKFVVNLRKPKVKKTKTS